MRQENLAKTFNNCELMMSDSLPRIRNTTRALILRNDHVLLIRKEYEDGRICYAFPGGGQDPGETLVEALNRECMEEIGTSVEVQRLLHVADYFKQADARQGKHLVEFFFECRIPDSYSPRNGLSPDRHQVAVIWKDIQQLEQTGFFMQTLVACLNNKQDTQQVYLGKFSQ